MRHRPHRWPCEAQVEIIAQGESHPATAFSGGLTGLGLSTSARLSPQMPVDVLVVGHRFGATVAWAKGGKAGLKFDRALNEQEFGQLRQSVARFRASKGRKHPCRNARLHGFSELR